MNFISVFIFMILCHLIADYYLQGWLGTSKQKSWWESQKEYNENYKNDYKICLLCHSLEWSIIIHIPIIVYQGYCTGFGLLLLILFQTVVHYVVDDLKANKKTMNLVENQFCHFLQIIISYLLLLCNSIL